MKFSLHCLFSFLFILPAFAACDRSEDSPSAAKFLTLGAYTQKEYYLDRNGDGNFVDNLDECDKDNTWLFKTDGTVDINEGPVSCDPSFAGAVTTENWVLQNNNTVIAFTIDDGFGGADTFYFEIVSFSENHLELVTHGSSLPKEKYILRR